MAALAPSHVLRYRQCWLKYDTVPSKAGEKWPRSKNPRDQVRFLPRARWPNAVPDVGRPPVMTLTLTQRAARPAAERLDVRRDRR
jgi:hypothetical protein